jgi:Tol biopolymer transport system component
MSDVEGSWLIYVYDLEDEELWLVSTNCETHCRLPAWSPEGRQLLYHASISLDDPTPAGLWIASVAGISKPRLYLEGSYGRPTWSSEGWIAFQGLDGIYRARPGRDPVIERYLYNDPTLAAFWSPVWSH